MQKVTESYPSILLHKSSKNQDHKFPKKVYNDQVQTFDLEERSFNFAKKVIDLTEKLPKSDKNKIHSNQILRSSSSIGANYIEANEGLGTKDFYLRLKIARKEAKETRFWLKLIEYSNSDLRYEIKILTDEVTELIKIFSSIINKAR